MRMHIGQPLMTDVLVNLNHFRLLRVVGRGAFGKVRIVERKDTNLSFALKYIRKDEGTLLLGEGPGVAEYSSLSCLNVGGGISLGRQLAATPRSCDARRTDQSADLNAVVKSESVRNIIRERRMLEHVNHPFICNLRYSFQDVEYMYDAILPLSLCGA